MYSSILSFTSRLDGVGGQSHDLADLPPGKNLYPFIRGMVGPHGLCGRARKISLPPAFDPLTIQPVASR